MKTSLPIAFLGNVKNLQLANAQFHVQELNSHLERTDPYTSDNQDSFDVNTHTQIDCLQFIAQSETIEMSSALLLRLNRFIQTIENVLPKFFGRGFPPGKLQIENNTKISTIFGQFNFNAIFLMRTHNLNL